MVEVKPIKYNDIKMSVTIKRLVMVIEEQGLFQKSKRRKVLDIKKISLRIARVFGRLNVLVIGGAKRKENINFFE